MTTSIKTVLFYGVTTVVFLLCVFDCNTLNAGHSCFRTPSPASFDLKEVTEKSPSCRPDETAVRIEKNNNFYIGADIPSLAFFINQSKKKQEDVFHLFTHGTVGKLYLDGEWKNTHQIALWLKNNQILSNKTHLNIYGCNFAQGEKGRAAVTYLEASLSVSIAASNDVTGKDGDWDLEVGTPIAEISLPGYQDNLQGDCDCAEKIYVNEGSALGNGEIHKFSVNPNGSLNEIGSPWFSDGGVALPSPHGLGVDLNGFLYIGENAVNGNIRKLTCDGNLLPTSEFNYFSNGQTNITSLGNNIYHNRSFNSGSNRVYEIDVCSQTETGSVELGNMNASNEWDWGLYKDPDTDIFYSTSDFFGNAANGDLYVYSASDFTIPPTTVNPVTLNPSLPANARIGGVTTDENGNIYIAVFSDPDQSNGAYILKYDASYNLAATSPVDSNGSDGGYYQLISLVYSKTAGLLYGGIEALGENTCIAVFDTDLNPLPNLYVPGTPGKGITILTECCPTQDLTLTETICSSGNGERVFLQELLSCGDGIICEGQWNVETSNANQVFNDCDLSITVNGVGCATYLLEKTSPATGNQNCSAFRIELQICAGLPSASVSTARGTCTSGSPNDNASIALSAISNSDEAGISTGATYTGPDYSDAANVAVSGNTATFANLMHNTQYTVRIFNGSNDCFSDETISTPNITCASTSNCDCTDYLYLAEVAGTGSIHKFQLDGTMPLPEIGSPWYGGTEFPNPHGMVADLNGFLYTSEEGSVADSDDTGIRRLTCDGVVLPDINNGGWSVNDTGNNLQSIGNTLYVSDGGILGIRSYDLCSGSVIGATACENLGFNTWELDYNYQTDRFTFGNDGGIYSLSSAELDAIIQTGGDCPPPLIPADSGGANAYSLGDNFIISTSTLIGSGNVWGITTDDNGNIYVMQSDISGNQGTIIVKFDAGGQYVTQSPSGTLGNGDGWASGIGIRYHTATNSIYHSNWSGQADCVSAWNVDLTTYTQAVPPTGIDLGYGIGKALSIVTECCPATPTLIYSETVCSSGNGERIFLQDVLSCEDGVICEGMWTVETPNANQFFNDCDLSISINGSGTGCGTYVLEKTTGASGNQQCDAFRIELQICTEVPTANLTTAQGTCAGSDSNDDATIAISEVMIADQAGIVAGSDYTGGPAYGNNNNINISGGTGSFAGLMHNTPYTIRIFNGSNDCFSDQTITTADITCAVTTYSLGNQVFYDDDINGTQNGSESGVDGVVLQLLNADGTVYDGDPGTSGIQALTVTTANGGYYRFDDLPTGDYIVEVLAATFAPNGILENYFSSDGAAQETNPNADTDFNDNGLDTPVLGSIRSAFISLGGTEPLGEAEPGTYGASSFNGTPAADTESNLTLDFGFYRQRDLPDCCGETENPCTDEPCHFISNDIYFGNGVTNDPNSNTNAEADTDTDDGLLWGNNLNLSPGGVLNLPVSIYNNTGNNAYFRVWIDWNDDGDFEDAGEQVADETYLFAVYSGSFTLNHLITIPTTAVQNQNLALRMRLSTDDTNTSDPCGNGNCANDGEIEDYLLRVNCPTDRCMLPGVTLLRRN